MDIFKLTLGTELEPSIKSTSCIEPDPFLEYKGLVFAIGMDEKLYIKEDGIWRKAHYKETENSNGNKEEKDNN